MLNLELNKSPIILNSILLLVLLVIQVVVLIL